MRPNQVTQLEFDRTREKGLWSLTCVLNDGSVGSSVLWIEIQVPAQPSTCRHQA